MKRRNKDKEPIYETGGERDSVIRIVKKKAIGIFSGHRLLIEMRHSAEIVSELECLTLSKSGPLMELPMCNWITPRSCTRLPGVYNRWG